MRKIKKLVHTLNHELESAENYGEKYIECKSEGDSSLAQKFREVAAQELAHADFVHEILVKEIDKITAVYTAPADMREKWKLAHNSYIEKENRIKALLNM